MARAIIVGSGMAGLTVAAYLARDGCKVNVLEQADHPGGVTATVRKAGFSWDLGPMALEGIAPGEPAGRLLKELGCDSMITLVRGDRGLFFPDFSVSRPSEYRGVDWRKERLKELFPHEAGNIDRFYKVLETTTDLITFERHSVVSGFPRSLVMKAGMLALVPFVKKYFNWNSRQLMDAFFRDKKLITFFLAILADMTILPEEYPALGVPFSNQENAYDRRIPARRALGIGPRNITYQFISGGCGGLVSAMIDVITKHGGAIRTGTTVRRILTEKSRVTGVELNNGERIDADLIFVSGGARECFFKMIGRESLPSDYASTIDRIPLMESILMVHLGVDMDLTPYQDVPLNYYYGIYDIDEGVTRARSGHFHGGKDGFLIYIPSLHSPQMAPAGKHAVTVYTIAPNSIKGGWQVNREKMADRLVREAERIIPGLRRHTRVRMILTPKDFGKLVHLNEHHSFGGYCPMMGRSGAPHRTPFRGLWFIGSQSETGPGVWTQIISSRNVFMKARREI